MDLFYEFLKQVQFASLTDDYPLLQYKGVETIKNDDFTVTEYHFNNIHLATVTESIWMSNVMFTIEGKEYFTNELLKFLDEKLNQLIILNA